MLPRLLSLLAALVFLSPAGAQPADRAPPLLLSFYYPWYGSPTGPGGRAHNSRFIHWEGVDEAAKSITSSTNYPTLGAYDSLDPAVIDSHCDLARAAGIDAFIISWWGKNSYEDATIKPLLDACERKGLKASIYYEQVAKPISPETAAAELTDLVARFGNHPAFLKVARDGRDRPVIFIYGRAIQQLGHSKWKNAVDQIADGIAPAGFDQEDAKPVQIAEPLLIADDFSDAALRIFDGAHAYGPMGDLAAAIKKGESAEAWAKRAMPWWSNTPRNAGKISCATVFPGYDDTKIRKPGLKVDRDRGKLYDMLWREAIAAKPDWILVTSFNEWHEGSEIEPSIEHGDAYIKRTAEHAAKFKAAKHK